MGDLLSRFFIDPTVLPEGPAGFVQVATLALAYGTVLFHASNLIAGGSELLLLVPAVAGIVGPVVLPVLGAVPDGAIVLFSGLGPNAQEQVSVGVGALAGSTIMLLTVPWFMSVVGGRVDIINGQAQYKKPRAAAPHWRKLSPNNFSLTRSGVAGSPFVSMGGLILLFTSAAYLIIQLPAFYAYYVGSSKDEMRTLEGWFAGAGLLACLAAFVGYLQFQFRQADQGMEKTSVWKSVRMRIKAIKELNLSLKAVLLEVRGINEVRGLMRHTSTAISAMVPPGAVAPGGMAEGEAPVSADMGLVERGMSFRPLLASVMPQIPIQFKKNLQEVLRPFFEDLDGDRNGSLDIGEVKHLLHSLNEYPTDEQLQRVFEGFDTDKSAYLDFEEFTETIIAYLLSPNTALRDPNAPSESSRVRSGSAPDDDAASEEEEEDVPVDLAHLPPEEQQKWIKRRAATMMALGTGLVLLFSDPMVGVLSDLGTRTGVPAFYISFVLAPLASNASELLASFAYSRKKTQKSIEISFSALIGAGCMNNTFCLGVFLAIVYFRGLIWEYSAETIAIIAVEVVMATVAQFEVVTLRTAYGVLALFPLSIALVAGLNRLGMR